MNKPAKIEVETLQSAYAKAFAEIDKALKSSTNPHFKSKYADITAVIESIKPALVKHGLFFTQHPMASDGSATIETKLWHDGSDECLSLGTVSVPVDRANAQGYGSALTYARRYGLVTAFGVPVEDDDGNAAAAAPSKSLADDTRVKIIQLCEAVGGDQVAQICGAFNVGSIADLSTKQGEAVIKRLNEKLEAKATEKDDA